MNKKVFISIIAILILISGGVLVYKYMITGDQGSAISDKNKINLTKELPFHITFDSSCKDTSTKFTGNLWIDKIYKEENNFNKFTVRVEVNEVSDKKYNIIAFLDKVGDVHEGGRGYVACSKYNIIPTSGIKIFTLDCSENDVFQEVGDVSRVFLDIIHEDYKNECYEPKIELKEAINKELFRPLIICSSPSRYDYGYSITKIDKDYVYVFHGGSFKLEIGKEFRMWEGLEAGTDYNLIKKDGKLILDIQEWKVPPVCSTIRSILSKCDKDYSFEINPDDKTCIKL